MDATHTYSTVRFTVVAFLLALTGCSDSTAVVSDDPVEIPTFSCSVESVNTNPFTVAEALALNVADHEEPSDYAWTAADVVPIMLHGDSISVGGAGATVSGSTVTISSGGTYSISGFLNDGQIVVNADDALVQLVFDGMSVTNSGDAAVLISKVDRAVIYLADGTTNSVADGATYPDSVDQNAAVFSKSDLSIAGDGALVVTGQYNDGITSKDGLVIAGGNITVTSVDDGIRGKDYLIIRDGIIDITAGGDGLVSDEADDGTVGYILIEGGSVDVTAEGDGLDAETDALVAGGTLVLNTGGGSSETVGATASAKGVKGTVSVVVDDGDLTIDAADDALHSDALVVINGGTIAIATGDDGVHSDTTLTINGGDINITESYEGIENREGDLTINGGRIHLVSSDDGINVAGAGDMGRPGTISSGNYHLYVNAGYIVSDATGDGIDINGSVVMNGGCLLVHGPVANNNGALDFGAFTMEGGLLVAAGSAGMAQAPGTSSTQSSVLLGFGTTEPAGTLVHIQAQDGEGILDFVPNRAFATLAFSSVDLEAGKTYDVYLGGTATGTLTDGLYQGGTYTPGTYLGDFTVSGN